MVQQAMTQTRELAHGLSPVRLAADGLAEALRGLATRTTRVFRLDCRFRCAAPLSVPNPAVASHLYRIAQEAVSNALKHGKARRIAIRLAARGNSIILSVRDNGRGIQTSPDSQTGLGIRIMHYRAEVIGGSLAVRPAPRGGTEVVCTVREGALPPLPKLQE